MRDVEITLRELELTHGVFVTVSYKLRSTRNNPGLWVGLEALTTTQDMFGRTLQCRLTANWPNINHKEFEGLLYSMLLRLDYLLEAKEYGDRTLD